ncbi:hypothetical protein [Jannaschia sp. R86511]|uniref:hypothetical protein n=1 Tax=Jannaschia sp. R86511 TaxID=3093853 RepID=UPI0036D331E3
MSVTAVVLLVVGTVVIVGAGLLVNRTIYREWSRPGRAPDGSWEKGRRVRDMTAGGKALLLVSLVAFVVALALRVVDRWPVALWACVAVAIVAAFLSHGSEKRRLKREGIEPRPDHQTGASQ